MQRHSCSVIGTEPLAGVVNFTFAGGKMDVTKILTELRHEREQIEEAIMSLERLARGRGRRRGRPPAWMAEIEKKRGRPPGSKNKPPTVQKAIGMV
jgi:hypothetical protein